MKSATVTELKKELKQRSSEELVDLCLTLSKFKKENKELLTYLIYDAADEANYINEVKKEVNEQFATINTHSFFFIKKSVRKILRFVKKHIRYSKKKETEVELLLHFCACLKSFQPSIYNNLVLKNIFDKQLELAQKAMLKVHEDLQYDYQLELDKLS